jgi:hypothetical protein
MKVDPASLPTGPGQPAAAKTAEPGFHSLLEALGASGRAQGPGVAAAASATTSASAVSSIASLLALQGGGPADARALALRKGRRLLDALDGLQVALLGEGPTQANLHALQGALAEARLETDDSGLNEALHWTEVRAAVEAAKLSRQSTG